MTYSNKNAINSLLKIETRHRPNSNPKPAMQTTKPATPKPATPYQVAPPAHHSNPGMKYAITTAQLPTIATRTKHPQCHRLDAGAWHVMQKNSSSAVAALSAQLEIVVRQAQPLVSQQLQLAFPADALRHALFPPRSSFAAPDRQSHAGERECQSGETLDSQDWRVPDYSPAPCPQRHGDLRLLHVALPLAPKQAK
jgi:hypothetical protein